MRTKASSCPYHQILYQFLKLIFKDFYEAGRKHLAFYNAKNKDYKAAARWVKDNQSDTAIPEPPSRPLKVLQPLKIDLGPGQKSINYEEAIKTLTPEHEAVVTSAMISSLNTLTSEDQAFISSLISSPNTANLEKLASEKTAIDSDDQPLSRLKAPGIDTPVSKRKRGTAIKTLKPVPPNLGPEEKTTPPV